jgi:hypothetical protein
MRGRADALVGLPQTLFAVVVSWLSFTAHCGYTLPRRSLSEESRFDEYGAFTFGSASPRRSFSKPNTPFLTSRLFSS